MRPIPWPNTQIRRASVNSFGFGGTNAHVVLDDARGFLLAHGLKGMHCTASEIPSALDLELNEADGAEGSGPPQSPVHVNGCTNAVTGSSDLEMDNQTDDLNQETNSAIKQLFVFASFDQAGIKRAADAYSDYLSTKAISNESDYLGDLAYTLAQKRTMFNWKGFVVAGTLKELLNRLPDAPRMAKHARKGQVPKLGFVFTGQGAQWHAMGRDLLVFPVFRRSLEDASAYLDSLDSPWHLLGKFSGRLYQNNLNLTVLQ